MTPSLRDSRLLFVGTLVIASAPFTEARPGDADSGLASSPRRVHVATNEQAALEGLSAFVYAVRGRSSEAVRAAWLTPQDALAVTDEAIRVSPDEIGSFVLSMTETRQPALRIVRPRLTWRDGQAVISCLAIWDVKFRDGARFRWSGREEFMLVESRGRFRIATGSVAPLVIKYAQRPEEFAKRLPDRRSFQAPSE